MSEESNDAAPNWKISLGQLSLIAVVFLIGMAVGEIVRNAQGAEKLSFSTTELVGFVLSVVLSAASIVLAIAAIWLGKVSEQSVIRRSDESIRLQNEVFVRTTEALQRIEASTGVTEKRIEDIITGRVGDISHKIANLAGRTSFIKDPKALENEIRQSILEGVHSKEDSEESSKRRKMLMEKQAKYEKFHQAVVTAFANKASFAAEKLGHGSFHADGGGLYDAIFDVNGVKAGVSALQEQTIHEPTFNEFVSRVAKSLITGNLGHAFIVVDTDGAMGPKLRQKIDKLLAIYKDSPSERVSLLVGDVTSIREAIAALDTSNIAVHTDAAR